MLLPPGRYVDGEEYIFDLCPSCYKISHFYWNIEKNVGVCHVCGYTITGYYTMISVVSGLSEVYIAPQFGLNYKYLREKGELHATSAWEIDEAREFLEERNISEALCRQIPFNWCDADRVMSVRIVPISNEYPEQYLYRYIMENGKWLYPKGISAKYYGFNLDRFYHSGRSVLLCEGIFDVCSSGMLDYAIALLGSSLHNSWVSWLASNCNKVAIAMDPDAAGEKGAASIAEKLNIYGIENKVFSSEKNPKDLRWSDPCDKKFLESILEYIE